MALGVCLLFNSRAERAIWELCDRLEESGVATLRSHTHRGHQVHLSYSVLVQWNLAAVRAAVAALPDGGPIEIVFQAVCVFPRGRICLAPAVPPELLTRQLSVTAAVLEAGAAVHQHYLPDNWLPHCALVPRARLEQLPEVAARVNDVLPLRAMVSRAALIDSATGEAWPLPHVP